MRIADYFPAQLPGRLLAAWCAPPRQCIRDPACGGAERRAGQIPVSYGLNSRGLSYPTVNATVMTQLV